MIPSDYKKPEWDNTRKCHDWKNHVPPYIQDIWHHFGMEQQQKLARWADDLASMEEWD